MARRKYDRNAHRRRFKSGKLTYRGKGAEKGSGHRAGEAWGAEKQIDPKSRITKYSKNSPSFDEGVWVYKENMKGNKRSYGWQFGDDAARWAAQFHINNPYDATNRELLRKLLDHQRHIKLLSDEEYDAMVGQLKRAWELGEVSFEQVGDFLSKNREKPPPAPWQPKPTQREVNPAPAVNQDRPPAPWKPPRHFSEDAAWWAEQFGPAAHHNASGMHRISPRRKESFGRVMVSRDPDNYDARNKHLDKDLLAVGRSRPGKKPKLQQPEQQKKKNKGGGGQQQPKREKLQERTSANMEYNPKTGLSEVKPWVPPKKKTDFPLTGGRKKATPLSEDHDWWQSRFSEAVQFYGADDSLLRKLAPPRGRHKPAQEDTRSEEQQAMDLEGSWFQRLVSNIGLGPKKASDKVIGGSKPRPKKRISLGSLLQPPPRPPNPPRPPGPYGQRGAGRLRRSHQGPGGAYPLSEDAGALIAEFLAERDPKRRRSIAEQAKFQFGYGDDWESPEEPDWRGEPEADAYHWRGQSAEFDRPRGQMQEGGHWQSDTARRKPGQRMRDEDIDETTHLQKMEAVAERLEAGHGVHPSVVQELLNKAAHVANTYMYPAGPYLGGGQSLEYTPEEGYESASDDGDNRMHTAYRIASERMLNAWHKLNGTQMSESADEYQGRLVAQFPSVYQPIQFGEKPPNLGRAEHIGRSCESCKHFKPKGGKEVDDQGRCALYDYVVKARMTCDAWTPTKEQQDFRGPGIMLDRKGGDPQHGGSSQMSEDAAALVAEINAERDPERRRSLIEQAKVIQLGYGPFDITPKPIKVRDTGLLSPNKKAEPLDRRDLWQSVGDDPTYGPSFLLAKPVLAADRLMQQKGIHERRRQQELDKRLKDNDQPDVTDEEAEAFRRQLQSLRYRGGQRQQQGRGLPMSEEAAYFDGYEQHLLEKYPERYA